MKKIKMFCVTNLESELLENLDLTLVGVGKKKFSKKYIDIKCGKNIQSKEKNYSELTFHYWFWKNQLPSESNKIWIGFCQKRRFWLRKNIKVKKFKDLKKNILKKVPNKWSNHESIICKSINVSNPKRMKLIKRGWRNWIKDPTIFFNKNKQTVKLQFDMHHGFGVLDKAIDVMKIKDREKFRNYINIKKKFNPNIMYISKKKILKKWFKDLFEWLFQCEKIFKIKKLSGYDQQRLYAFLAERYASYWFKQHSKYIEWDWTFFDTKSKNNK